MLSKTEQMTTILLHYRREVTIMQQLEKASPRSRAPTITSVTSSMISSEQEEEEVEEEEEEEEEEGEEEVAFQPFPFFNLPFELRTQVLENVLCVNRTIDIDFNVSGITSIFLVSKRFHEESATVFFSKNKFRLFPTHSQAASKRAQPLVRKFPARYRRMITRLEFRLGPFWTNPPACWKIDVKLGLKDLVKVRRLDVFVECDPSHSMYAGFRKSEMFYTQFSSKLFESMLRRMPALKEVRFDGFSGVSATGTLVQTLVALAQSKSKIISWEDGLSRCRYSEKIDLDLNLFTSALDSLSLQLLTPHAQMLEVG